MACSLFTFMTKKRKPSPFLIPLFLLIVFCIATSDKFGKSYFMSQSFGYDLNYWTSGYRTKWYDGVLEVWGVSRDDKIISVYIGDARSIEPNLYMESDNKTYSREYGVAIIGWKDFYSDRVDNTHNKYVVYYPEKKLLVFIYAHTFLP